MFPLFLKFINMHCTLQMHYFHAYKCNSDDCSFHMPLWNNPLNHFGDLVPYTDENGKEHYHLGEDPDEKYMPSKLENPAKRKHGLSFPPTAQTTLNVVITISCTKCRKPGLIYSKLKLKPNDIKALTIPTGENLCFIEFSTKNHWNTKLAASEVFHIFTQSIKFF